MKKKYTTYIETKEFGENTHIWIKIYYDLGGINYFNYKNEPRGYYISVLPIKINNDGMSFYSPLDGIKSLIKEANRYSEKALKEAIETGKAMQDNLIEQLKIEYAKRHAV